MSAAPTLTKVFAGEYTFRAVGQTLRVVQIGDAWQSLASWHVLDEQDRLVATGASRRAAISEYLEKAGGR